MKMTSQMQAAVSATVPTPRMFWILERLERNHGWLAAATARRQARQALHLQITAAAIAYDPALHGYVFDAPDIEPGDAIMPVIVWSRDCDCCEGTSLSYIRASLAAYDRHCEYLADGAEGPWRISIATPDEAAEFQPECRDRVLEAFENGNSYNV